MPRRDPLGLPEVRLPRLPTVREPAKWNRSEVAFRRRAPAYVTRFEPERPAGPMPAWWLARYPGGTEPEWAIWWALVRQGKQAEQDFFVHAGIGAQGRGVLLNKTIDFVLPYDRVAIEVQGLYWHYLSTAKQATDARRYADLVGAGYSVVFIDEDDALARPIWAAREALAGRDHSKASRRF
ncbi:MAG: hypothetical protein IT340_19985 [Chloroflexi bacterium]|nr:hypothetical protein [Chloroflexota bacterium]